MDMIQRKWDNPISRTANNMDGYSMPEDEEHPNKSMHSEDQDTMFKSFIRDEGAKRDAYDDIVEDVEHLRLETMLKEKGSNYNEAVDQSFYKDYTIFKQIAEVNFPL